MPVALSGSHDIALVVLAILIAISASYTALDIAARINATSSRAGAIGWLAAAAVCMGGGIWAMHFVAMLAYVVPGMAVTYDPWLTSLSLLIAVVVTGGGFAVVSRSSSPYLLVISGFVMGCGVLAMHYVGMAAMQMSATISYGVTWVAISVLIAIGAAIAALWLAFRGGGLSQKILSALAMGLAISGMHFAGMQAASFGAHGHPADMHSAATVSQSGLALAVATITFFILLSAMVAAMFDRRFAALASKEALSLKQSEEMFRTLYRRTPLPLHALDEDGKIRDVSDAWLSLLSYERDAVIGRPLINFMTEESARQRINDWRRLLAEGELREREYRLVSRDGRFIDVLSTSRVERDADGKFIQTVGGLVDVTARRQAEEALRQAQKMEAVGQLTGGVAHDFNNVLAVILGNLEMLRKRLSGDDRLTRLVDNASEGARRGAALTQRMLSFSRRQSLSPQPVEIKTLVGGMSDLLERSLGPRQVLEADLPADLPQIQVDPHQLEMALLNLIVNARDAMDQGAISIRCHLTKSVPAELGDGNFLCISVSDTGNGMDETTLVRAKEPFFTTKGVGQGTGLGLSMVSGFVEQSGGYLQIHSRVGVGTTVDLWLPVTTGSSGSGAAQAAAAKKQFDLQNVEVLMVDDEPLLLLSAGSMLQDAGAEVHTAATAMDALELLRKHPNIACLVTDYAMPGMTGSQLAAAARVKKPDIAVIVATGYVEVPDEIAGYLRLQKPFTEAALVEAVAQSVAHRASQAVAFQSRQ